VTTFVLGAALVAALTSPQTVPLTSIPNAAALRAVVDRDSDVSLMLAGLNSRRVGRGLAPLQLEPRLCKIAYEHAADMVIRNYFDHYTPEGVSPFARMDQAHYPYGYAGENIALDQSTPAAELALWQSPEHRGNILEPHYAKVGIAAVTSHDGLVFVEDFSD
jgi:uncharacterized protein YkwD